MTPPPSTVRAFGNIALTACAALFALLILAPRPWGATAVIALAVIGAGCRIEAAIRETRA